MKFLRTDLKIPKEDEESIQFDRLHWVSARRASSGTPNSKPRPIIVKLKNLTKGRNLGISDNFPKEVEEMRKKLYPVLKAAKQEKRSVSFKVEIKANYRSVALPRPRDNCFPSLRTFNGRII